DWGAMQFLQLSETTRRRLLLEELLLMLLRMGLIALLVLALAAPYLASPLLAELGIAPNRDVVLVFGGGSGMSSTASGQTPHEAPRQWAKNFLGQLAPGDSVAVFQAREQVVPIVAEPSHDLERVRKKIDELPPPGGGCNWPLAVREAHQVLAAKS